jgi:Domain of unknown function (DUF305)
MSPPARALKQTADGKTAPHSVVPFLARWLGPGAVLALGIATLAWAEAPRPTPADEAPFLAENEAAMDKMMADMTVQPTGDVDHDFVEMMVPHHQGAIDMAQALLRYGNNERLRRLAQEIIVTQQQEIAAMRLAVGEPLPPMVAATDQPSAAESPAHLQILKPQ